MRLSLVTSACTTAVLSTVLTLPLLAQSAPQITRMTVVGKGKHAIHMQCKDGEALGQCIDGAQGLSSKEKSHLKAMAPKLQAELAKALAKSRADSNACFALRVFTFPKGFPEKDGKVQAKVTECTSAALVKEKPAVMQRGRVKGQ